ncbi:hypothetical protein ACFY9H_09645 [Streptomyces bacillaris]|uniref:Uncharacterized protein n=1 Tax=Streptomyces cavourensis TaxID=67258 RepID=A0AAD0Q9Z4_9ACTN|nr:MULTISPECIES: hypothetical protein [Streptomyces]ATY99333.1 hypothetical protein CVT27_30415 [Streptomyces cavourensis]AXI75163.1 hypothetical protein DTW94_30570 [Streptomyces cavourensis]NUV39873.1 hypothetical protein [Streptomyces sp. CAI-24]WAE69784.1 hypothetical protein OUQ49_30660 [Streptomyces cavourensis]
MSTSDQDQDRVRTQREGRDRGTDTPIAEGTTAQAAEDTASDTRTDADTRTDTDTEVRTDADVRTGAGADARSDAAADVDADTDADGYGDGDRDDDGERRLTPRQARRLRIALSSVGMVAMGVVLALRIASRSSVLVVGVYGLALILCGVVIELSRNGRTRLGSWLLGVGLVAAVGADWLLLP